ncbi:hypothetical protein ACHAWF_017222 [Thalassiosira exigua]
MLFPSKRGELVLHHCRKQSRRRGRQLPLPPIILILPLICFLAALRRPPPCHALFVSPNDSKPSAGENDGAGDSSENADNNDDDFFPPLIEADDVSFFFSTYDLEGLHWGLTNIFQRSARNPNLVGEKQLPQALVARGGGDTYTTEYKLKHDLEQARYLVEQLKRSDPEVSEYFKFQVIPVYERVLQHIPPLEELQRTKGLYAFTKEDYAAGISNVYNKALYMTTADELDSGWREYGNTQGLLNDSLDWGDIQQSWFGQKDSTEANGKPVEYDAPSVPGVIVVDDLLAPRTLSLLRTLLLRNTHWFQTKTPLEFGKYVGSYVDDGLNDPIFLELAKQLHQSMPRVMAGHHLRYMWAYKYDSEWESGINLHADQAAVNVNMWLSLDDADLEEEGFGGGLVVFTAKPPDHWDFESYNTKTEFVVEELLRPTNFANVTVRHKPNRAVIFDSALFHQTDKYRFKKGYENGRINLTLLFGEMPSKSGAGDATKDRSAQQEL